MEFWGTKLRQKTLKTTHLTVKVNTFGYMEANVASNRETREFSGAT